MAVLAGTVQTVFALPLTARIHEGPKFTNRDRRTPLDHLVVMAAGLKVGRPFYLLGDVHYATRTVIGENETGSARSCFERGDAAGIFPNSVKSPASRFARASRGKVSN